MEITLFPGSVSLSSPLTASLFLCRLWLSSYLLLYFSPSLFPSFLSIRPFLFSVSIIFCSFFCLSLHCLSFSFVVSYISLFHSFFFFSCAISDCLYLTHFSLCPFWSLSLPISTCFFPSPLLSFIYLFVLFLCLCVFLCFYSLSLSH